MLWESLWRKPSCTTGMTWICRTWWITSRKRCSGQFYLVRGVVHVSVAIYITELFKLIMTSGWVCPNQKTTTRDHIAVYLRLFRPCWAWDALCHILFLYSVGLLMQYSSSICTPWHTYEPRFFPQERSQTGRMYYTEQDRVSKYTPVLSFCSLSLSSSVVDGITTRTGPGTCTLIVHMRTPAQSAVACLIPAALLFLERFVLFCVAS